MSFRFRILESSPQSPLDPEVTENGGCLLRKNRVSPCVPSNHPRLVGRTSSLFGVRLGVWCFGYLCCGECTRVACQGKGLLDEEEVRLCGGRIGLFELGRPRVFRIAAW